mmetsp:Transcript_2697/g.6886  ORF Transcript_2697/g.6886 Transcript_2697/m.6886 type:complete len:746 (-) Transcript_2697:49-2286(-)
MPALNRTSTLKSKGEEKEEDACPSWVNGIKSVLDVALQEPDFDPPVNPPVASYLEEVTLGMIGGAGDPTAQVASAVRRAGTRPTAVNRMQALLAVVAGEAACSACRAIFWLTLGGIFGHVPEKALSGFRAELGKSWYALTLQTMAETQNDRELQDAVFFAFPYVFAQAVYRLFVDGFVEDRKHFVMEGDKLLLKASMVAHFEVTGFQVTSETVRRARQRLFLRRVVQSPHADQRELMKGRKRQEILESHSAGAGEQPLEFGKFGNAFDETQLDHVMHESEQNRRKEQKALSDGKPAWLLDTTPVPAELSVERYAQLASTGAELLDRHMNELKVCMGQECEEEHAQEEECTASPFSSPPGSEPPSPQLSPPGSPMARSRGGATWSTAASLLSPTSPGLEPESPTGSACGMEGPPDGSSSPTDSASPTRSRRLWRRGLIVAKVTMAKEDSRARKKREDQAKKMRREMLAQKISSEALPKELLERSLNTTWVSPPMMSNACSQDRLVLHKTSTDSFHLRMAVNSLQPRPLSTPVSRSTGKPRPRRHHGHDSSLGGGASSSQGGGNGAAGGDSSVRVGSAMARAEGLNPSASAPSVLPRVSSQSGKTGAAKGEAMPPSASAPLPRVVAALSGKPVANIKGEVIGLEPPPRLSGKVVSQRLEGHIKMFQKQSFAIYMKEHDILTGFKKNISDPRRLRDEEDAYVKKMVGLVGSEPKRRIAPEGVRDRHLRESSAEDHLSSVASAAKQGSK